jgi:P27 family predicted phage terminase small subunit
MGRARKSEEQHWLQHSVPDYVPQKPSQFTGGRPKMPKHLNLNADAADFWKRLVKELGKRGTLTRVDGCALEIAAITYARWRACVAEIEKYGPLVDESFLSRSGELCTRRVEIFAVQKTDGMVCPPCFRW